MSQHASSLPSASQPSHALAGISPVRQAWWLLYLGFIAAPILAGLDKFTNLMTDWTQYIAPVASNLLGGYDQTFMYVVGVVEIVAGLGVALRPQWFGYVVAGWLLAIILNLLLAGAYYDLALRDLGLLLAALALARLSLTDAKPF